jgi:hypothetical protein
MSAVFERLRAILSQASADASAKAVDSLPEAAFAIAVVILGWLAASIIYFLTVRVLGFFAVDKLAGKTPLTRMLRGIGIEKSVSSIIALLIFWMAVLATLIAASEILHLEQVSRVLALVTGYIPQVIAAFLIVVFGMLLAKFLQTIVVQAVARAEVGYERTAGKAVHLLVLILVFLAASEQLGFDLSFVTTNVLLVLGAILLVLGIAFVISMRAFLENAVASRALRRELKVGEWLRIGDIEGTVHSFSRTGVIVRDAEGSTTIPASFFERQSYTVRRAP